MEASMQNYSISLPSYSIGESVLERIGEVCSPWGRRAVLIGGERALSAIAGKLTECVLRDGRIELSGPLKYGGEASLENVHSLILMLVTLDTRLLKDVEITRHLALSYLDLMLQ